MDKSVFDCQNLSIIDCLHPVCVTQNSEEAPGPCVLSCHLPAAVLRLLHLRPVLQNTVGGGEDVLAGDQGAAAEVILHPVRIFVPEEF